jgi:phosphohistidine swiveling domain-containing protein
MTNGHFHILQARPITTLATEYNEVLVDDRYQWQTMVRRPMSLLEVSVVGHWLDSEHAGNTLGSHADQCLFIQDDAGIANFFLSEPALTAARKHLADMIRTNRDEMMQLLQRAQRIAETGKAGVEAATESIYDMQSAGEYMIQVGEYTTSLPASLLVTMEEEHINDQEITKIAQGLRSQSLYPVVERNLIDPLAEKLAREIGFSEPEQIIHVASWHELSDLSISVDKLEQRLARVKQGKKFIYQCLSGKESVQFVDETGYLLSRIARQHQIPVVDDPDVLNGQTAWPGIYRGRARIVLAPDAVGQIIEKGDVLVSIQSSPALMPLLTRAGAIVTDEGGVACHAAIICRELKIPTLIGTGTATNSINTGDMLEVDATHGVVRVLERA